MSASNRWAVDIGEARARARAAAGTSDRTARMAEFRALCAELGEAANRYACPLTAARALVHVAALTYTTERKKKVRRG